MPRKNYAEGLAKDNAAQAMRGRFDRDIGRDCPPPGDLVCRRPCEVDLQLFLSTYFKNAFPLEFSNNHQASDQQDAEHDSRGRFVCDLVTAGERENQHLDPAPLCGLCSMVIVASSR